LLRADDFHGFFRERKAALLALVERAMGKQAVVSSEEAAEDGSETEEGAFQQAGA
jgi:hypothetical protein